MASNPVSIFFSYSRKDEALMQELKSHLGSLELSGLISTWHDGCIAPGEEWEPQIKENLENAQIILLLISVDFINSRYCHDVELTRAIARHQTGDAHVIPVLMRSCLWEPIPVGEMRLGDLQALPKDAKPISRWSDRDDAFTNVAEGLFEKILQIQLEQAEAEAAERQRQAAATRRQQEQAERQQKGRDYFKGGLYHLQQGNYDQAIADLRQAEHYGHPDASHQLAEAQRQREEADKKQRAVEAERKRREAEAQKQREAAERKRREAEAQKQREEAERKRREAEDEISTQKSGLLTSLYDFLLKPVSLQVSEDDLSSEKGIDYGRLRDLLKAGDWKAADYETYLRMLEAVGRKKGDWIRAEELLNFPCKDLLTIDRLWVKYSRGRFGFSVQKQIYVECGGQLDGQYPGDKIWRQFGEKVGWRVNGNWISYSSVTFSTSARKGHLPVGWLFGCCGGWWGGGLWLVSSLASRLAKCNP